MRSCSPSRLFLSVAALVACVVGLATTPVPQRAPIAPTKVARFRRMSYLGPSRRLFSPNSFWNTPVPVHAPLDASSRAIVAAFSAEATGLAEINTRFYSAPIYTVSARQPRVRVTLIDPWRAPGGRALQSAWASVPLPPHAQPGAGTDQQLILWQPTTDRLWEFWKLQHSATGWQAAWGGAIRHVSTNPGVYGPTAWPGATTFWGASASSLSIAGGLITLGDLARGRISHALALGIYNPRAGVFASPAERTDGRSRDPLSLPEGAHLRLDPRLALGPLHLPPLTRMLAEAAQRYGIVIRDTVAGDVTFYAQDPTPTGTEPYFGQNGYYGGETPRQFLASFPWRHLQLLAMKLTKAG